MRCVLLRSFMNKDARPGRITRRTILGFALVFVAAVVGISLWLGERIEGQNRADDNLSRYGRFFAEAWLSYVRAGRLTEAYDVTSSAYKAKTNRSEFGRAVADRPQMKIAPVRSYWSPADGQTRTGALLDGLRRNEWPHRFIFTAILPSKVSRQEQVNVSVIAEDNWLRVEQFMIEPVSPPRACYELQQKCGSALRSIRRLKAR
jgi:hypothetical protein